MDCAATRSKAAGFADIPEEILEKILHYLCVYRDYSNIRLVCKRWNNVTIGLARYARLKLERAITAGDVKWHLMSACAEGQEPRWITERYAQCACYLDKALYIFGGCTPTATTYNDVWMFDLAANHWIRPVMSGTYPPPKAYASMVAWQNKLIVFGGWSPPNAFPLHQAALFFNHLHTYCPQFNCWSLVPTDFSPPPTAGHCACVLAAYNKMIVFGGSHRYGTNTNKLWILDLPSMVWQEAAICPGSGMPPPRYGASAHALDGEHVLVLGGCRGGPDNQLADIWLLTALDGGCLWHWKQMDVRHPEFGPTALWCYPTCLVGDKVVVLCRSKHRAESLTQQQGSCRQSAYQGHSNGRRSRGYATATSAGIHRRPVAEHPTADAGAGSVGDAPSPPQHSERNAPVGGCAAAEGRGAVAADGWCAPASVRATRAHPSNGNAATVRDGPVDVPLGVAGNAAAQASGPHVRPRGQPDRQRQLEVLSRYEERFASRRHQNPGGDAAQRAPAVPPQQLEPNGVPPAAFSRGAMQLQMLDTSAAVSGGFVVWLEPRGDGSRSAGGIGERSFYSLVQARGELVLFGGIRPDMAPAAERLSVSPDAITNSLVFIRPCVLNCSS